MATILKAYGWECGNAMLTSVDTSNTGYMQAISGGAKTGSYKLFVGGDWHHWARWSIPGIPANPSVSVWINPDDCYDDYEMYLRFLLDTGEYIDLRWNTGTHTFDAYVDGSLVAGGSVEVSNNDWFHVQFYLVVADSGSIQVKIDGHESINYSGDTKPQAGTTGATYFYAYGGGGGTKNFFIDDLVIGTGGFLGDLRCYDLRPSADTAQADWTPSTGSDHYALLDETPEDDADYVSTATNGHADELELEDFDASDKTPVAVVAWVRAKADDAVGAQLKVGVDSGGTDDVETVDLSTAWEYYFHTMDDNPADSAEWEDADIDALKLRYEAVIS